MGRARADSLTVVVFGGYGVWHSGALPARVAAYLGGLIAVARQPTGANAAVALGNVADEFFVAVRVRGEEVRLLLSDVTAAVAWDLARQVVDRLGIPAPGEDDLEDVWPAGALSIFGDLGLDEMELGAVLADLDAYADEMLLAIALRLGFADVYDRAVEAAAP